MKQIIVLAIFLFISFSSFASSPLKFSCVIEDNPNFNFVLNTEKNELLSENDGGWLDGLRYLPSDESAICYEEEVMANSYSSTILCFKKSLQQYAKGDKINATFTMIDYGWDTEDKFKMTCQRL